MKKKFTTTLGEEVIKKLKVKAIEEGTSVADILEKLIDKYLEK